ncbi:histidine kinase [bacterium]|nr:histidine kinase [bacterium]
MFKWSKLFKKPDDSYRQALTEFSRSLTLIVDFDQLLENLEGKLREIADIPRVYIFLKDPETNRFDLANPHDDDQSDTRFNFSADDRLIQWLTVNEMPLVVENYSGVISFLSERERELIIKHQTQIIIPLIVMNHLSGMVFLGPKSTGPFAKGEIELLVTLLGQSALAFENALLYREQKQRLRKMFRSDRLATIGQIAAGAAHEIRNPLTSIRSTIQYLKKKDPDNERREMMDELISEVDRIDEIIKGLLSFSKPIKPQKERLDLTDLICKTLKLTGSTARNNKVKIDFTTSVTPCFLNADPQQLRQVFMNIILNSVQAMPSGGTLSIHIESITGQDRNEWVRIDFTDNGMGIPETQLEKIFDPFFTTKNDGTGLGLSISYGIIRQHNGDIEVQSISGKAPSGTSIIITLPANERISQ